MRSCADLRKHPTIVPNPARRHFRVSRIECDANAVSAKAVATNPVALHRKTGRAQCLPLIEPRLNTVARNHDLAPANPVAASKLDEARRRSSLVGAGTNLS
jgi:hypothetical protein